MRPQVGKMQAAEIVLRRVIGIPVTSDWRVIADRMRGVADRDPRIAITGLSWIEPTQSVRIRPMKGRFRAYERADWYRSLRSDMKLAVESNRTKHFLYPYRLTFVADDFTGVTPAELLRVLEVLPDFHLKMLELSFDFLGHLTRRQIRQMILFGKTRPAPSVGQTDYWGSRKGMKRCCFYFKKQIQVSRLETELGPRFLKHYGIKDIFDFCKLPEIMRAHISLNAFNEKSLSRRLSGMGFSKKRQTEIKKSVRRFDGDLWPILNYLREDVGMKNARRLVDLTKENRRMFAALEAWALQWPTKATRLRRRP